MLTVRPSSLAVLGVGLLLLAPALAADALLPALPGAGAPLLDSSAGRGVFDGRLNGMDVHVGPLLSLADRGVGPQTPLDAETLAYLLVVLHRELEKPQIFDGVAYRDVFLTPLG